MAYLLVHASFKGRQSLLASPGCPEAIRRHPWTYLRRIRTGRMRASVFSARVEEKEDQKIEVMLCGIDTASLTDMQRESVLRDLPKIAATLSPLLPPDRARHFEVLELLYGWESWFSPLPKREDIVPDAIIGTGDRRIVLEWLLASTVFLVAILVLKWVLSLTPFLALPDVMIAFFLYGLFVAGAVGFPTLVELFGESGPMACFYGFLYAVALIWSSQEPVAALSSGLANGMLLAIGCWPIGMVVEAYRHRFLGAIAVRFLATLACIGWVSLVFFFVRF